MSFVFFKSESCLFYKKQAEAAEDEMNRYASKYKMMQHAVSEAEERAEYAERRLEKLRSMRKWLKYETS